MLRHFAAISVVVMWAAPVVAQSDGGHFEGPLVTLWLEDGRSMELTEGFAFVDAEGRRWSVPAGAWVNGASIPRSLWTIVGAPFVGSHRRSSVVHDFFCPDDLDDPWASPIQPPYVSPADVHQMFYAALLAEGTPARALLMFAAVNYFGPIWGRPRLLETLSDRVRLKAERLGSAQRSGAVLPRDWMKRPSSGWRPG